MDPGNAKVLAVGPYNMLFRLTGRSSGHLGRQMLVDLMGGLPCPRIALLEQFAPVGSCLSSLSSDCSVCAMSAVGGAVCVTERGGRALCDFLQQHSASGGCWHTCNPLYTNAREESNLPLGFYQRAVTAAEFASVACFN